MALDASLLEEEILNRLAEVTPLIFTNEITDTTVDVTVDADGKEVYTVNETRGPIYLNGRALEKMRPLARAIAQACIEHFKAHCEIDGNDRRVS